MGCTLKIYGVTQKEVQTKNKGSCTHPTMLLRVTGQPPQSRPCPPLSCYFAFLFPSLSFFVEPEILISPRPQVQKPITLPLWSHSIQLKESFSTLLILRQARESYIYSSTLVWAFVKDLCGGHTTQNWKVHMHYNCYWLHPLKSHQCSLNSQPLQRPFKKPKAVISSN